MKAQGEPETIVTPSNTERLKNDTSNDVDEDDGDARERRRREKKERAVKDREAKVKAEREKLEASINQSKMGLDREEGESFFRCAEGLFCTLLVTRRGANYYVCFLIARC
jgi:transcription elongation regulator 1